MTSFQREIDVRSEHCPVPVIMTKHALKGMTSGEVLHVVSTDPVSVQDITMLVAAIHYELVESSESNGDFHFYIRKN